MTSSGGNHSGRVTNPGRGLATDEHGPEVLEETADARGALTLARAIVAVVFCGFGVVALLFVLASGANAAEVALACVCLSGLLALQYFYFGRPSANLRSPGAYVALAVQAGLAYLPLAVFDASWVSQPSFLAGTVFPVDARLGSRSYFDLNATFHAMDKLTFSLGVNNVFDKDPPLVGASMISATSGNGNTYPGVYDALGRYIYFSATIRY